MSENLTQQQRAAVENRGRSLLVSAAAGSGKTKVLVERLFSYVEQDGADLDDFLIITYTRAAASELRGKIAKALSERLESDPSNVHLQRQMLRVYRADIKTVDAFCTGLLRENCHLLGEDEQGHTLRPDFRVLDESDVDLLRQRTLNRVLDRFYDSLSDGDGGTLLADTLGAGRDDSKLSELVLELHTKLQSQPRAEAWLAEQRLFWENLPQQIEDTPYGRILLSEVKRKALHWSRLLQNAAQEMQCSDVLNQKYAPVFLDVSGQLDALAAATKISWDKARSVGIVFPSLAPVKDADGGTLKSRMKSLWDSCKASIRTVLEYFDVTGTEAIDDLRAVAPAMLALLDLTADFTRAYQREKRRRNAADFSDQEHEAIRLLVDANGQPTELARTVSCRYREIMVDEYQDTNEVQNLIFDAISQNGKNLFTVGDVKQSIYRFRLADPRIFLKAYNAFPDAETAAEGESGKLLLSRNFRSRAEVLEAANFVFENVMSEEMGELDYGEAEKLHVGASYEKGDCYQTEFHLLDLPTQSGQERISAAQAEAAFVADYIRQMLSSKFPIQDDATKLPRPVREEDIVILMRSPRVRLFEYRRALEAQGLHCSCEADSDFYESMEIAVIFALLQVIDNPRQDVPLISVLRSPLFGFTPDQLALLRAKTPKGDFYDALCADEDAQSQRFLDTLRLLREDALHKGVRELLLEIYHRCNVLGIFGAMPNGEERRENLMAFFELAEEFEAVGHTGLFSFVTYLRDLLRDGKAPSPQTAHYAGGVRIMSIHKSKGLEFPVVILSDLAKRFNHMDFGGSVLVHQQFGIGPMCVDMKRHIQYPTLAREAIERVLRREAKAEELRILYVAMTRAKEKLVMVHTQANAAKRVSDLYAAASCPVLPESVDEGKCLGDWVMLPLLCRNEASELRALAGQEENAAVVSDLPWIVHVHDGLSCVAQENCSTRGEAGQMTHAELPFDCEALEYRYPYEKETALPAKLTATQLKGRLLDAEISENVALPPRLRSLSKPKFLAGEKTLTGADRGTAIHLCLQYLDFAAQTEEEVRAQIMEMLTHRLITKEQADAVDTKAITAFLQSPIAARIRASGRVEREYRFSVLRPISDYVSGTSDDKLLLQGVVDCFFEEQDGLAVLDFKTDRITRAETAQRAEHYRPQLEAYALALEKITEKPVREKVLYFFATNEFVKL
ncbi:MAG: helicase-exonuclease AddAB subunit AddA [Eubacteriales bacterium]|nr:helicase-exonuclease AddAB subunit AddA [Eubacteriales bacterium]